jgi:transposase
VGAGRGLVLVRNKEKPSMKIIGCDFHPSFQQIAVFETETGEITEHKLVNGNGEAETFYRNLPVGSLIGIEACGNSHWFIDLLGRLGHQVRVGDAAKIRASYVRKQKTDRRDAAHILTLLLENRFPKLWTPSRQERDQRQLLIHRHKLVQIRTRVKNSLQHLALNQGVQKKQKLWSKPGQKILLQLPLEGWTAVRRQDCRQLLAQLDEQIARLDKAAEQTAKAHPQASLLLQQKGVGPITALAFALTIGDVSRFEHSNQVASYLGLIPSENTSSNKRRLGSITKQGNGFVRMLLVEAGTERDPVRSAVSQTLRSPVPQQAQGSRQGGCGTQIGRTALLGATHRSELQESRAYREQLAGAPGRRKLDRYVDWALSHPTVRRKEGK